MIVWMVRLGGLLFGFSLALVLAGGPGWLIWVLGAAGVAIPLIAWIVEDSARTNARRLEEREER